METTFSPVDTTLLLDLGEPEFVLEMVDLYAETSAAYVTRIGKALEASDGAELTKAAHALKGASLGMFAALVAGLAADLERAGKTNRFDAARGLYAELGTAFADAVQCMRCATKEQAGCLATPKDRSP
jgi:HPt (histidine-containing phosphotransfer) domain-containing protein